LREKLVSQARPNELQRGSLSGYKKGLTKFTLFEMVSSFY